MRTQFTKSQLELIEDILFSVKKAESYLMQDKIKICMISNLSGNNDNSIFINNESIRIMELSKFYGSDLMHIKNAITKLNYLINPEID